MTTDHHSYSHPISPRYRWPDGAIVYQIYPRSLADTNGDGIGDLQGIIGKLDYLKSFGVNAIWLSPFYPSPMVDFGYDISDYTAVDPMFGTLDDFKTLLQEAHSHGIKLMADLVVNHTSDKHAWFEESRRSRDNPKADWYIWRDAKIDDRTGERQPPNNWRDALVGDSAWQWDDVRQQYYMHSWHAAQPDLNWANKQVRNAIKDVMRFWLDMGVDGFRADAVDWMAKDPLFRDDPVNPAYDPATQGRYDELTHTNSKGWPTEYAYLAAMTGVLEEPAYAQEHRFMVAETYQERHNPAEAYIAFYGGIDPEVAAPFNFEGLYLAWSAHEWREFLISFHGGLHALNPMSIPSYAFGNHDNSRLATRIGDAAARSAALMQLTLPGMIFVYYGEEIGMHDAQLAASDMHDVYFRSRDPARTPMQWSPETHAGFSTAERTWLPVAADYQTVNVATESNDMYSFLSLYRTLGRLRNTSAALRYGGLEVLDIQTPDVLGYIRRSEESGEAYLVLVNFSGQPVVCSPGIPVRQLLLSSNPETKLGRGDQSTEGVVELLAYEAALFIC